MTDDSAADVMVVGQSSDVLMTDGRPSSKPGERVLAADIRRDKFGLRHWLVADGDGGWRRED